MIFSEERREKRRLANQKYLAKHRDRINSERRERYLHDPEFRRKLHDNTVRHLEKTGPDVDKRFRDYGMTLSDFIVMAVQQGAQCAICGRFGALVIDHDHNTDRVRGLLCRGCNAALGKFGDSIAGLETARRYLLRSAV